MPVSSETRRAVSYIFIGALAVLFALEWGPGSRGCTSGVLNEQDAVATVNGTPIVARDYAIDYSQQVEALRRAGTDSEAIKRLNLGQMVLDQMVNAEVLAQEAEARGLRASDDDLRRLYNTSPMFLRDGAFDSEAFNDYVRSIGLSAVQFEDKLRRQLAAQRMLELVESLAIVSEEEVRNAYFRQFNSAQIGFVAFQPTMFAGSAKKPTLAEIQTWTSSHSKEISDFYDLNKFSYEIPARIHLRQIFKRLPPGASQEEKDRIRSDIDQVRANVSAAKMTFADAARTLSEDEETRANGGDLGFVDKFTLPPRFAEALATLKSGEMTPAIETAGGFFLGFLESKQEAQQRPLAEVQGEIAGQVIVRSRSRDLAHEAALRALALAQKGIPLSKQFPEDADSTNGSRTFLQDRNPTYKRTSAFSIAADTVPKLGPSPEIKNAIFAQTTPGTIPAALPEGDGFVVVDVLERSMATEAKFLEVRTEQSAKALMERRREVRDDFLRALRDKSAVKLHEKTLARITGSES